MTQSPPHGSGQAHGAAGRPAAAAPGLGGAGQTHAASAAAAAERRLRQHCAGTRVLLAEDNAVNQEVAVALLEAAGLQVDCAADGEAALALATRTAYALILLDVQMPRLSGLAAAPRLRALALHASTPIIAMTANAFGEDRAACLACGMDDHVAKPVDPAHLYATLLHWLRPEAAHRAAPELSPAPTPTPTRTWAAAVELGTAPDAKPAHAARWGHIPGLEPTRALLYLPGHEAAFERSLRRFVDGFQATDQALRQAAAAGQWAEARRLAHALRGACGAIGATELQALAHKLEQRLVLHDHAASAFVAERHPGPWALWPLATAGAAGHGLDAEVATLARALHELVAALQQAL